MDLLLNERFYFSVVAICVLMNIEIAGVRRTFWFGLNNLVILIFLLGWKPALGAGIIALFLWLLLRSYQLLRRKGAAAVVLAALYAIAACSFLYYKSAIDKHAFLSTGREIAARFYPAEQLLAVMVAVSFSYVLLRIVDAIRAIHQGQRLLDPLALMGYLLPFFMLPAGPIAAYEKHLEMDSGRSEAHGIVAIANALNLITNGLVLKVVVAEAMRIFFAGAAGPLPTGSAFNTFCLLLYMYFEFAGYSLVAMGVGQLASVPTPRNFNNPLLAKSVTEFWARWHISLGDFVKRHIFIPTQVNIVRRSGVKWAYWANLAAVELSFAFTGIWHRMSLPLLAWGALNGVIVGLEKMVGPRFRRSPLMQRPILAKVTGVLGNLYTLACISLTLHISIKDMLQR